MGLLRRRSVDGRHGIADSFANHNVDEELQEQAQEVMKDNMTMMRDVVMRIREDPDFAKGIYKDCPRFQHLLKQYPDLRPVFEDPKLVKINFETVYREAGGVLPEDEVEKKSLLVRFVQSPIFKLLKLVLFIKRLFACIAGGGIALVVAYVTGCCFEDPPIDDIDGVEDIGMEQDATKEALNRAAEHMEDPDVQEQMRFLLEDPDNMEEVIENDEQLRVLQASNPLCEELMTDPETMKVLTDPDNLRALGECSDLIQADFMDPDGFTPDEFDTTAVADYGEVLDLDVGEADPGDTYGEFEVDIDGDDQDGFDEQNPEEGDDFGEAGEEEEENIFEDGELEAQDQDNGGKGGKSRNRTQDNTASNRGNGGVMASMGAAAADLVAGAVIGSIFGDTLDLGGGDDGLGAADDLAETGAEAGEGIEDDVANATEVAEGAAEGVDEKAEECLDNGVAGAGDVAEGAADGMDDKKEARKVAAAGAVAGGALVAGGVAAVALHRNRRTGVDEDDEELSTDGLLEAEDDSKPKKKFISAFKKVRNAAALIGATAKEHVATSLLGDDWGEALVERKNDKKKEGEAADDNDYQKGNETDDEGVKSA